MAETTKKSASNWTNALKLSKGDQKEWMERSRKIVKRYRDEREGSLGEVRYNILWSNVRTIFPAVYAKKPQAQVERRFKDADPVGRCAAEILERCLQYEIDHCSDYDSAIRGAVLDRLLPGRGVAWVRFEPGRQVAAQVTDDAMQGGESAGAEEDAAPAPFVGRDYDYSPVDYVYWEDFRCSPARTWEEVTWVARRVYMSKDEGIERFDEDFKEVPLTHEPVGLEELKNDLAGSGEAEGMKKAEVWEIWDKSSKKAIWIAQGCGHILDEKADPLELEEFFPCPKPLFATTTTDTIIPIPDYIEYQDQARELDEITRRIGSLVKAVKVVGVYDASQTGIQRMLEEGTDNTMIPIENWAVFGEKGGIEGGMQFLPLDKVMVALSQLYVAREQVKQVIYEVTGLSDIIRGASMAQETATAQQIKSNFASLRLKETIADIARFASHLLRIKAEMMCSFYSAESLIQMSGIMSTQDAQLAPQAIQLLKSGPARDYRIEVAADSMVELDEQAEKASRLEFLTAAGTFLDKAVQAGMAVPEMAPLFGEMLMFGVRSFKGGRQMEGAFEQAVAKMSQPKPQGPSPAEVEAKAEQEKLQAELQAKMQMHQMTLQANIQMAQVKAQSDYQIQMAKISAESQSKQIQSANDAQIDQGNASAQMQLDMMRNMNEIEFARWKAELDAATKIETANIASKAKVDNEATQAATGEIASEVQQ